MPNYSRRAVFFDRDGTLIYDAGYLKDPQQVRLLPGVGRALATLKEHGFLLVLVSNQSGIGRGLVTVEQAEQVHSQVVSDLAEYGIQLDAVFYCPHAPEEQCSCRKPSPGMLLRAAGELDLDLARSFMIGDKASDIEAGKRAGCRTILLTANSVPALDPTPDYITADWSEVVRYILNSIGQES